MQEVPEDTLKAVPSARGKTVTITNTVPDLTGRQRKTAADFVLENASVFRGYRLAWADAQEQHQTSPGIRCEDGGRTGVGQRGWYRSRRLMDGVGLATVARRHSAVERRLWETRPPRAIQLTGRT
jgi:hypothetical protein